MRFYKSGLPPVALVDEGLAKPKQSLEGDEGERYGYDR